MKTYLSILQNRMSVLFQYRTAALASIFTQFFWGAIKVMVITAFYANVSSPQPLSLFQAVTFIWIGQAFLQLLPWQIDKEIEYQIKNGNIACELIRPLDLYWYWFTRSLAMRIIPTLWRSLPLFLLASLFFNFPLPISWLSAVAFGFSFILAVILSTAITVLLIISLFWTVSGDGLLCLAPHVSLFLSGLIVPLPLFPTWMQPFLNLQPLRGIIDIPSRLYTGVIPFNQVPYYLGFQVFWILILIFIGKKLMQKALRQFVIQGG